MAKLIPPTFPFPNDRMRKAERLFFEACAKQLDEKWRVLYNVSWTGPRNGHNDDCDADFLLIHPDLGLFTIEVKGGQKVWVESGQWFTLPHGKIEAQKIKDPAIQASESKRFLFNFIRSNTNVRLNGSFGHLVVFPGHTQIGDMAPHLPRRLICDSHDLKDLGKKFEDLARYWNQKHQLKEEDVETIVDSLVPSFELIGASRYLVDEVEQKLELLTSAQLEIWSILDNAEKLVITGGAGTGKTLLAFNHALNLANRGFRVLFICATAGLAHSLHEQFQLRQHVARESIFLVSEEEYSAAVAKSIQSGREFNSEIEIESMFEALKILNPEIDENIEFEAVVVDEAQSVSSRLFEIYSILNSQQIRIFIFGDHFQDWNDDSVLAGTRVDERKTLSINCRSTGEISEYAADFINRQEESRQLKSVNGPEVTAEFTNRSHLVTATAEIVKTWMSDYSLSDEEIVILCDRSVLPDVNIDSAEIPRGISLHETFAIDWRTYWETSEVWSPPSWKISRKNREPQALLNAVASKDTRDFHVFKENFGLPLVQVCPISSFLGLESLAVLVITSFSRPDGVANPARIESDMYVACSRARSILGLLVVGPS